MPSTIQFGTGPEVRQGNYQVQPYEYENANPSATTKEGISKLYNAIDVSRRRLKFNRDQRRDVIEQYVGSHYAFAGSDDRVPVNFMELAINIYSRQLAANIPKVNVVVKDPRLQPTASNLEQGLERLFEEMNFQESSNDVVVEALTSFGAMKVGMYWDRQVEVEGQYFDAGQPYADWIDLDDWVHDTSAKRFKDCDFLGHKIRLPYKYVMESPEYENTAGLAPTHKSDYDENGIRKTSSISNGNETSSNNFGLDGDEYQAYIELWELFIPKENLIITIPVEGRGASGGGRTGMPIRMEPWQGPEGGPYHILSFSSVPSNPMPLPPAAVWKDLHELANILFNKLAFQAERQKDILAYDGEAEKDVERLVDTNDGESIRVTHPDKIREMKFGGIDQTNLAFFLTLKDQFSWFAGNLDTLGGLSAGAQTLGQEQILGAGASKRVQDMGQKSQGFFQRVVKSLAWYYFHDPLLEAPLTKQIPHTDLEFSYIFTADDIEGDFEEYNFQIEPYSMQHRSPGERLNAIMTFVSQIAIPLMPLMQQAGLNLNMEELTKIYAKYAHIDEINRLITFEEQRKQDGTAFSPPEGIHQVGMKAPNSPTHNIRENISSGTRQSNDAALRDTLMGAAMTNTDMGNIMKGA